VDALAADDASEARKATHFVSWCWRYTIETVITSLKLCVVESQGQLCDHAFWICFFCNNQRQMLIENGSPFNLSDIVSARLINIGRMVILLNSFHDPVYTTRVWCIFEAFTATKNSVEIQVALPTAAKEEFTYQLKNDGFGDVAHSLTTIDSASAEATIKADEKMIKDVIRESIGFAAVNEMVKCALMRWLAFAFQDVLKAEATSDVARSIMKLMNHGKSGTHSHFQLAEWIVFIRQHPQLLNFLDMDDMMPDEAFTVLIESSHEADRAGTVCLEDLDRFLKRHNKCQMEVFALWLQTVDGDSELIRIRHDIEAEMHHKLEHLREQAKIIEQVFSDAEMDGHGKAFL
jgi:hypothetical protein